MDKTRSQVQDEENNHQQNDDMHWHHVFRVLQRQIHPPDQEENETHKEQSGEGKQTVLRSWKLAVGIDGFVFSGKTDETRTIVATNT